MSVKIENLSQEIEKGFLFLGAFVTAQKINSEQQ